MGSEDYEETDQVHNSGLLIISHLLCVPYPYEKWVGREKYPSALSGSQIA